MREPKTYYIIVLYIWLIYIYICIYIYIYCPSHLGGDAGGGQMVAIIGSLYPKQPQQQWNSSALNDKLVDPVHACLRLEISSPCRCRLEEGAGQVEIVERDLTCAM